jgi:hypothetical protein
MALARVNALFVDRIERLGLVRVSRTPSSDGDAAASPSPSGSRRSDAPCASNDESGADDGDYLEINFAPTPPWTLWNLAQTTWGFLLAHYIFYGFVASALACAFIELTAVKAALAVGLVLYQKSFWDGSELRSGRPWHAFRAHPVWNLTQSYFPARLIRTRALDASEKYVFGWHPHGASRPSSSREPIHDPIPSDADRADKLVPIRPRRRGERRSLRTHVSLITVISLIAPLLSSPPFPRRPPNTGILILSRIMIYGGVWELLFPGVPFRVLAASPMFKGAFYLTLVPIRPRRRGERRSLRTFPGASLRPRAPRSRSRRVATRQLRERGPR